MLVLQRMEYLTEKYSSHLQNLINGSSLRFMIGPTIDEHVDYLNVSIFYENDTNDSFPVHVLPVLTKKVFKAISEEYVTALQTISFALLHPIIALEFIVNETNA
jgi:hypothetical protein